jgi:hypothetical protein
MWMSDARISRARETIWLTRRITGASLAMSRSWAMSSISRSTTMSASSGCQRA